MQYMGGLFLPPFSLLISLAQLFLLPSFWSFFFIYIQLQAASHLFILTHCCQVVVHLLPEQELAVKISELQCPFGAKQTSPLEFVK